MEIEVVRKMERKRKRNDKKIKQEIKDTMSSTDETKESLKEYRTWPENHRHLFIKLLNKARKREIFANHNWDSQPDDPEGIWFALANLTN